MPHLGKQHSLVVTSANKVAEIESAEALIARINEAARYVGLDRLVMGSV